MRLQKRGFCLGLFILRRSKYNNKRPPTTHQTQRVHPNQQTQQQHAISTSKKPTTETIYFDGGAHHGDLVANLILGFILLWALILRYTFTNLQVTVFSGLTGQDRSDFSYKVIKDVQVVPRFIGEWGDIIISLRDGTKVDLRSVPKFREDAKYCLSLANKPAVLKETGTKGFSFNLI